MTSPYEGFPLAASETMMLGFRRSQSNPERYRIYFRRQGCGLTDPLDPKLDGDRLHRNTKGHDPQSAAHLWIFQNGPLS